MKMNSELVNQKYGQSEEKWNVTYWPINKDKETEQWLQAQ